MHNLDMFSKITHGKFLITMWAGFLDPLMDFPHMSDEVVHTDFLLAIWTCRLLSMMNTLHVVVQQLFGLKLFIAVRTLVVPDLLMEEFYMMM